MTWRGLLFSFIYLTSPSDRADYFPSNILLIQYWGLLYSFIYLTRPLELTIFLQISYVSTVSSIGVHCILSFILQVLQNWLFSFKYLTWPAKGFIVFIQLQYLTWLSERLFSFKYLTYPVGIGVHCIHSFISHDLQSWLFSFKYLTYPVKGFTAFIQLSHITCSGSLISSGYVPDQYPSSVEWEARRMMEFSLAIKCPTINYHLVGTKKVRTSGQAVL